MQNKLVTTLHLQFTTQKKPTPAMESTEFSVSSCILFFSALLVTLAWSVLVAAGHEMSPQFEFYPLILPKKKLYDEYKESWNDTSSAIVERVNRFTMPLEPVSFSLFVRYWACDMPLLRIAATGSGFCATCTKLKNTLSSAAMEDIHRDAAQTYLEGHLLEAKTEFRLYQKIQEMGPQYNKTDTRHFVFDFAEKVLLPKLQKQPGQLHFITGLKFDIFGVSCSNDRETDIYGLVEGHLPNEKTANTVLSMLHHSIIARSPVSENGLLGKRLLLHADNCGGQNKNRFLLFYIVWRTLVGLENEVTLYFLVAGHTKNVCDGCFGHVKRRLLRSDVKTPGDMMTLIGDSSIGNCCIAGSSVSWLNWKQLLGRYFAIPSSMRLSKYHVFTAKSSKPGVITMQSLSNSTSSLSYVLLRSNVDMPTLADLNDSNYKAVLPSLSLVSSKQHETRRNYLKVNILDRYYAGDEDLESEFFADCTKE